MGAFIEAGFDPTSFWALTPKTYMLYMNAARKRMERERNEFAWLAWHTAYLPRTKRPIKIEKLFAAHGAVKRKNWKEQLSDWETYIQYNKKKGCSA